jgi:hypothetical protein
LNVSWDEVLSLVLNEDEWNAWMDSMEVVGVVFIATNHILDIAHFLPTADDSHSWPGRSAPAHQQVLS